MLKKIDKKFIYICSGLIIAPLLLIAFLMIIRGCSGNITYEKYEDKMVKAAEKYFKNKAKLPKSEGGEVSVSLTDLVEDGYLKSTEKLLDDDTCKGNVTVTNNGASVEKNDGGYYLYIPDLKCDDYNTIHLIDKLTEKIVTSKSGLYKIEDGYIYKGDKVNNYVSFFNKEYRIISVDNDGILKMVKTEPEKNSVIWDDKYNVDDRQVSGKNDYSDSNIIDQLAINYSKMKDDQKKHLIAYNVCYGNRPSEYVNIDKTNECSNVLEGQFISLMNTYDYASVSYDKDCIKYNSLACRNYNYLYDTIETTWLMNGNADNSYEVYYYSDGHVDISKANRGKKYNQVIYINGNELYIKGDGSKENPYVIK